MITVTDKSTLKARMLDVCIRKQESLIEDFKERIKALLENGPLGNEDEYDNATRAQNIQNSDEVNLLNTALTFANGEMEILRRLESAVPKTHTYPALGSVVVTNKTVFFVSVSIEQFEIDGEIFAGLSAESPLFLAMKEKKKGETFSFRGITYKISDIF